jgi:hypothetical protein
MGCDIHAFVEVQATAGGPFWPLFHGQARLPRDYPLFAAIAGVRGSSPPTIPPRGIPPDVSEEVFDHYYMGVIDDADVFSFYRGFEFLTLAEAAGEVLLPRDTKRSGIAARYGYVPYPDWHTPSWLLLPEIEEVLRLAGLTPADLPPEYRLLLDTLASAERHLQARSRLVFWFDN